MRGLAAHPHAGRRLEDACVHGDLQRLELFHDGLPDEGGPVRVAGTLDRGVDLPDGGLRHGNIDQFDVFRALIRHEVYIHPHATWGPNIFLAQCVFTQYIHLSMRRGCVTKDESRLINVWVPIILIPAIDEAVRVTDTDRSKFIRAAVREKIERLGGGFALQAGRRSR